MSDSGKQRVHLIAKVVLLSLAAWIVLDLALGARGVAQRQGAGIIGPNFVITDVNSIYLPPYTETNDSIFWDYNNVSIGIPPLVVNSDVLFFSDDHHHENIMTVSGVSDPNVPIVIQIYDANYLSDESVRLIIESGRACEVRGHSCRVGWWGDDKCRPGQFGHLAHSISNDLRTCVMCLLTQNQNKEWE